MGFSHVQSNHGLYTLLRDDINVFITVVLNDIMFAGSDGALIDSIVKNLSQHFKLHDLGATTQLLGLQIHSDRPNRRLHLSQGQYIAYVLQEHGMHDCKPVSTPLNPGSRLSISMSPQNAAEVSDMHQVPYISVVGSLMYLAVTTRPDIAYAADGPSYWEAVKHVLCYPLPSWAV